MNWYRVARDALVVRGIVAAVMIWATYTFGPLSQPVDVRYYWASDPAHLYPHAELAEKDGYNCSPVYITSWAMLVGVLPFARQMAGRWLLRRGITFERRSAAC